MTIFTKVGAEIASPVDATGAQRRVSNHDFQVWMTEMELAALARAVGAVTFGTKEEADLALTYDPWTTAWIVADPTVANNGWYTKFGASGSGSWVRKGDLPYSYIKATNAGAGTANAIVATTATPIPAADGGALIALPIVADTTASPVTVTINDVTYTIKTNSGNDVAEGGLTAGMIVAGYKSGTTFRLLSDADVSAAVAAAEAAQAAAEQARDEAVAALANTARTAASKTAVKSLSPATHSVAFVNDGASWDEFTWVSGDLSALVDADTAEAIYVQSSVDGYDKTQGAWVRTAAVKGDKWRLEWFDPDAGTSASASAALTAALSLAGEMVGDTLMATGGLEIELRPAPYAYYFATEVVKPSSLDGVSITGPRGKGALVYTDQEIVMLQIGEDLSGGGDAASSNPIYRSSLSNLMFKNLTLDNQAVAVQANRAVASEVHDCDFYNFYISLDCYRVNNPEWRGSHFRNTARTVAALAFIRMQGVYDSSSVYTPGGGVHMADIEMLGNPSDHSMQTHGMLVHSCDGMYRVNCHTGQCMFGFTISPDGTAQNNIITDINSVTDYFDDPATGGRNVQIIGSLSAGGLLQDVSFTGGLFRGANNANYGLVVSVSDAGDFASGGGKIENILVNASRFRQHVIQGISVSGADSFRLEVYNFKVSATTFEDENGGGAATTSDIAIEAASVSLIGNTHRAARNAASRAIGVNLSGADTTRAAFIMSSPDFSESNYTVEPLTIDNDAGAIVHIDYGLLPGAKRKIRGTFYKQTIGDVAAIPYSLVLANNTLATLRANVIGIGTSSYVAYEVRAVARRDGSGTTTLITSQVVRSNENLSNNGQPVAAVLQSGSAWTSGASVSVGTVLTNSGNAYLVIEAGSGTTGTTGPTHGTGTATDSNSVRYAYIGATNTNLLVLVVVAASGVNLNWSADIDLDMVTLQ